MNVALWMAQVLVALMFLYAGGVKLVWPPEMLQGPFPLPILLIRVIGVFEILGAIGLILPGLLRIRPGLTPLAAACLVILMVGATVITFATMGPVGVIPLVIGLLAAFVAYGRWRLVPLSARSTASGLGRSQATLATDG
jgi:hypothetical protein